MLNDITDASFPNIYIVGPNLIQNRLLALCLEKEIKVECTCQTDLTVREIINTAPERMRVFLLDCFMRETAELHKCLQAGSATHTDRFHAALFNVDSYSRIEKLVRRHKVRGIFFKDDTRQVFLKGMRTILGGNMWLSRRILSKRILSSNDDDRGVALLSDREKEALVLVAKGFSNDEIAEKMHISPHTVKTHLYNVYKKIGVSSRLQATVWAGAHLCAYPGKDASMQRTDQAVK